ncbi:lipopolysaccharide biosynthesis protein [Fulvivirga ligni]|uniref:lipopolysaccharide biosynthesis protein n=1 Tax=Fulvivirga ligni TaxID=2904246 RepID=UPI001F30976F|nr:lipopolysaccharide biosynthesis protein [Fulvivirga ligni]UII23870.1 lipopolysaccharide biosynthesis protein [Fulvivirga ligni]
MGVGKDIFSGVVWTTIQTVINRGFGFVIKLFLARILFPEDYGLVGMATIFIAFVRVFNDIGIGAALIQLKKEKLTELHLNTAFWTGIVWSLLVYIIVSLGVAPFAAWFYNEELLRLFIPILSIGVLASPINLVHRVQLTKDLNFKRLALINNLSSIFSGVLSLTLAYFGAGVWALVFNTVSAFIIAMPLYFKATGWYPKRRWSKKCFKEIFGFGVYTTGTQLFNKITGQIDYLLVGKFLGAVSLGQYSFAFILTDTFRGQLVEILNKVMYPIYAKMQDDQSQMNYYYLQVVRINASLVYPIMMYLLVFANNLIPFLFGQKWNESIILIQILTISVIIHMLVNSNGTLIRAAGKPNFELKLEMIKTVVLFVPMIIAGVYFYGVVGVAIGYTIAKLFATILSLFYTQKLFNLGIPSVLKAISTPFLASGVPALLAFICITLTNSFIWSNAIFIIFLGLNYYSFFKKDLGIILKFLKGGSKSL